MGHSGKEGINTGARLCEDVDQMRAVQWRRSVPQQHTVCRYTDEKRVAPRCKILLWACITVLQLQYMYIHIRVFSLNFTTHRGGCSLCVQFVRAARIINSIRCQVPSTAILYTGAETTACFDKGCNQRLQQQFDINWWGKNVFVKDASTLVIQLGIDEMPSDREKKKPVKARSTKSWSA